MEGVIMAYEEKVDVLQGPQKVTDATKWKLVKPDAEKADEKKPAMVSEEDGKRQG
jgi:hypothetical protein